MSQKGCKVVLSKLLEAFTFSFCRSDELLNFKLNPNIPFSPRKTPIFYGWVVLVVGVCGAMASLPGQTAGVSVFTDSLLAATGLKRFGLSNAYLAGTLLSGALVFRAGRWIDRFGCRVVSMMGVLGLALALGYMSLAGSFPKGNVVFVFLVIGIFAIRFFGQGIMTLSARVMLGKWFDKRRGLVSGLYGVFVSLGFSIAPLFLNVVIDASGGWKEAWRVLGGFLLLVVLPFVWVFFRDSPESCGLLMDGEEHSIDSTSESNKAPMLGLESKKAIRTATFWILTLTLCVHASMYTGLTFHVVDIGRLAGLSKEGALQLFPPIALVGMATGLIGGTLSDKVSIRSLLVVLLICQCVGYGSMGWLVVPWIKMLSILAVGVTSGLYGLLSVAALPKCFGRLHLGSISSMQMSALVVASALGPSLLALSLKVFGSYRAGFVFSAILPVLILCWLFTCLLYTSPSPRDATLSRMPSSA